MSHATLPPDTKQRLRRLLYGRTSAPSITNGILLAANVFIIFLSLVGLIIGAEKTILYIEFTFGILFGIEYLLRFWISRNKGAFIFRMVNMLDILAIGSLLLTVFAPSLAFLRFLRMLQILRSYKLIGKRFDNHNEFIHRNLEIVTAIVNILVFLVIMSTIVFFQQQIINDSINTYVDALYFTIATVTTTGFGDIVVAGTLGKIISIFIMVFGVTLFFRLVKSIFVPKQLYAVCPGCGHDTHILSAHFCAQCGHKVKNKYRTEQKRKHKDDF